MQEKVNALIVGAQKCGTTALFEMLASHPDVATPCGLKEAHFFDNEMVFAQPRPNYRAYHRHFSGAREEKIWLDATPIYMWWRPAPERIAAYNSSMKLILTVRDPVERAVSQWLMQRNAYGEPETFSQALRLENEFRLQNPWAQSRIRSYVDRGFFGEQLRRLRRYFPREHILTITQDQLLDDTRNTLSQICLFLEIEPGREMRLLSSGVERAARKQLENVDCKIINDLRILYYEDLVDFSALTDIDVGKWIPRLG